MSAGTLSRRKEYFLDFQLRQVLLRELAKWDIILKGDLPVYEVVS